MKFAEYAPLALRTCKPMDHEQQVDHACLGMFTETGELADMIKKHIIANKPLDYVNGMEEAADICWYFNLWCYEMNIAPKMLDEALVMMESEPLSEMPLDKHVIAIGQMVAALSIDAANRGVPDAPAALALLALLENFVRRMGFKIGDSLARNIAKLEARYKTGTFTPEQALHRDHAAERVVLEEGGRPGANIHGIGPDVGT